MIFSFPICYSPPSLPLPPPPQKKKKLKKINWGIFFQELSWEEEKQPETFQICSLSTGSQGLIYVEGYG